MTAVPQILRIGQARLTAGLDRLQRIDLAGHQAIFGPTPTLTITELIKLADQVDLRGRGGAAFPVARKLQAVARTAHARKCRTMVVVNATEGEPGSAKDKMLLLRSPYLVLAGAQLVARALRAKQVVVAVAGDGPHVRSLSEAVNADPESRRLVIVVSVPDRFVSGEGGALVLSTILMSTFYVSRQSPLFKAQGMRWGLLVMGAMSFMYSYRLWSGPWENIPFGEIEGVNLSDPTRLTEEYGWSTIQLVDRYLRLARFCLVALAVLYTWGLITTYLEMRSPASSAEQVAPASVGAEKL